MSITYVISVHDSTFLIPDHIKKYFPVPDIFVDVRGRFVGKSVQKYAKYVCFLSNKNALKIGLNA